MSATDRLTLAAINLLVLLVQLIRQARFLAQAPIRILTLTLSLNLSLTLSLALPVLHTNHPHLT